MDGRRFGPTDVQKGAQRMAVGTAPSNDTLGIIAFKVTDGEHAEESAWRNARSPAFGNIYL